MPLYAYRCEKCGHEEEHIERFSDDPVNKCESCGGRTKRQISATAFHLKGGGWYADGYASSGGGGSSDSGSSTSSDSGKSSSSSSSSKPSKPSGSKASGE